MQVIIAKELRVNVNNYEMTAKSDCIKNFVVEN